MSVIRVYYRFDFVNCQHLLMKYSYNFCLFLLVNIAMLKIEEIPHVRSTQKSGYHFRLSGREPHSPASVGPDFCDFPPFITKFSCDGPTNSSPSEKIGPDRYRYDGAFSISFAPNPENPRSRTVQFSLAVPSAVLISDCRLSFRPVRSCHSACLKFCFAPAPHSGQIFCPECPVQRSDSIVSCRKFRLRAPYFAGIYKKTTAVRKDSSCLQSDSVNWIGSAQQQIILCLPAWRLPRTGTGSTAPWSWTGTPLQREPGYRRERRRS